MGQAEQNSQDRTGRIEQPIKDTQCWYMTAKTGQPKKIREAKWERQADFQDRTAKTRQPEEHSSLDRMVRKGQND
jgi:hypothetical protein